MSHTLALAVSNDGCIWLIFFAICLVGCIGFLLGLYNGYSQGHEDGFSTGWDCGFYHGETGDMTPLKVLPLEESDLSGRSELDSTPILSL